MRIVPMQCGFRRNGVQCQQAAGHRDDHVLDEEFVLTIDGLVPTGRTGRDILAPQHARALCVLHALESCHEELTRLELIPTDDADDINALSAAKGLLARARNILRGRFA